MQNTDIYTIEGEDIPIPLREIPYPPKKLFIKGSLPRLNAKILCIVGSRRHTSYGELIINRLISGLRGYNICIVSGLAKGIDGLAHRAALDAGLQTIAFPGSGLDLSVLYPPSHRRLAEEIIYNGGALISEFPMTAHAQDWMFPQRNRLMAGISQATIVIEAGLPSGSLITTKLAHDYNRDVGAVPGDITSKMSDGPNSLLKYYATPITSSIDILELLGIESSNSIYEGKIIQKELMLSLSDIERRIIEFLQFESLTNDQIVAKTDMSASIISESLSALEIQGYVVEINGRFMIK